jgi:hypothetical protein
MNWRIGRLWHSPRLELTKSPASQSDLLNTAPITLGSTPAGGGHSLRTASTVTGCFVSCQIAHAVALAASDEIGPVFLKERKGFFLRHAVYPLLFTKDCNVKKPG